MDEKQQSRLGGAVAMSRREPLLRRASGLFSSWNGTGLRPEMLFVRWPKRPHAQAKRLFSGRRPADRGRRCSRRSRRM